MSRSDKILFIDTETGGLDPSKYSLLSIAFVVWQEFEIVDSIEIFINDGRLIANEEALRINKIDLNFHEEIAVSIPMASIKINEFLSKHFDTNEKITLAGHNVNFDINFFKPFLKEGNIDFEKRFSYRFIDTSTILYYLYLSGVMKKKTLSSQQAFDFFGIKVNKRHSALGDALATAKLFSVLLRMIYKNAKLSDININQKSLFETTSK